jgi:hypothetical protein
MPSSSALTLVCLSNPCYRGLGGMPSSRVMPRKMIIPLGVLREDAHSYGCARGLIYY